MYYNTIINCHVIIWQGPVSPCSMHSFSFWAFYSPLHPLTFTDVNSLACWPRCTRTTGWPGPPAPWTHGGSSYTAWRRPSCSGTPPAPRSCCWSCCRCYPRWSRRSARLPGSRPPRTSTPRRSPVEEFLLRYKEIQFYKKWLCLSQLVFPYTILPLLYYIIWNPSVHVLSPYLTRITSLVRVSSPIS